MGAYTYTFLFNCSIKHFLNDRPYDTYEGEVDEIEFTLHVKNEKEEHLMVMSTDLITGSNSRSDVVPIGHADFCQDQETNKAVPLVKLKKGQEIKFKAIAQKVN